MNSLRLTNFLLLAIVLPVVVIVIKWLNFIFIPLIFAMFITLLFIPGLRKLKKLGLGKALRVAIALLIICLGSVLVFQVLRLSSQEIIQTKGQFVEQLQLKITEIDRKSVV